MNRFKMLVLLLVLPLFMFGCSSTDTVENKNTFEQDYGSYKVEDGWVKDDSCSSEFITFYVKEGNEIQEQSDNVAIYGEESEFSADDHEKLKDSLISFLHEQVPEDSGVEVSVDGKTTKDGSYYCVAGVDDGEVNLKIYFILGDHKWVKMQATSFDRDEEVFEVAEHLADSFEWNKK